MDNSLKLILKQSVKNLKKKSKYQVSNNAITLIRLCMRKYNKEFFLEISVFPVDKLTLI